MNSLGMLADGLEIAAKKAPAFTDILLKYWWISVPTLFVIYKRWQQHRKNLEFEDALMQTVLDTSPVVSSAIALGFLVAQTKPTNTPQTAQKTVEKERVIDVTSYSIDPPQTNAPQQTAAARKQKP